MKKHFHAPPPKQNYDSDYDQPKKKVALPSGAPDLYKPSNASKPAWAQKRESDRGEETRQSMMSSASDRNDLPSQGGDRASSRSGRRPSSRARKGVCVEEHKTRVINTSKHIYKPSFNLPKKEKVEVAEVRKKAETYHLPADMRKNQQAAQNNQVKNNLFGPKSNQTNQKSNTSQTKATPSAKNAGVAKSSTIEASAKSSKPPLVKKGQASTSQITPAID